MFVGHLDSVAMTQPSHLYRERSHRQYTVCVAVPIKLYLYRLPFEFHIIFIIMKYYSFDFGDRYKNGKITLSFVETQSSGWNWLTGRSVPTPDTVGMGKILI